MENFLNQKGNKNKKEGKTDERERDKMKTNLKHIILSKLNERKAIMDKELINSLKKDNYDFSLKELNFALLELEIGGLILTRWSGKDKRRIELIEKEKKEEG
ncbi:MAG: hypothetical protein ACP5K8_00575 [Nitrososphaeria archaeon]